MLAVLLILLVVLLCCLRCRVSTPCACHQLPLHKHVHVHSSPRAAVGWYLSSWVLHSATHFAGRSHLWGREVAALHVHQKLYRYRVCHCDAQLPPAAKAGTMVTSNQSWGQSFGDLLSLEPCRTVLCCCKAAGKPLKLAPAWQQHCCKRGHALGPFLMVLFPVGCRGSVETGCCSKHTTKFARYFLLRFARVGFAYEAFQWCCREGIPYAAALLVDGCRLLAWKGRACCAAAQLADGLCCLPGKGPHCLLVSWCLRERGGICCSGVLLMVHVA